VYGPTQSAGCNCIDLPLAKYILSTSSAEWHLAAGYGLMVSFMASTNEANLSDGDPAATMLARARTSGGWGRQIHQVGSVAQVTPRSIPQASDR
jgi:hypothetical protein